MSFAIPIKEAFLSNDMRAVLDFFDVRIDVSYIGNRFFEVNLRLRDGTSHRLLLDFASLLVRRSMLNVLSSIMNPMLYQAFSSRLNHCFISNPQERRIEEYDSAFVTIPETDLNRLEESADELLTGSQEIRIIPLPYRVDTENPSRNRKRRHTTIASLLGEPEYFVCKQCFKSFNRRFNLNRHIDKTHCDHLVFNCPHCPAVYKHAYHFADHLRGHEEDPQFPCENCEKKFMSRNQLRSHKKRNCVEHPSKKHPATIRRSRKYEPQSGRSTSNERIGNTEPDGSNGSENFHVPYDFPVTL